MPENTLGLSSLDRLRELKEATERRQAEGRRQIVDLPIGEIRPDPQQVRTDFAAAAVSAEDREDLEGLARNIASIGVHNPLHVRPDPEGGYLILAGERRWRAAAMAGLETVPCLVVGDADLDSGRSTLIQLSENLQRSNLKLLDVAHALKRCLDETGISQVDLAKEIGKSKSWVSKYLTLLRAEGPFREALEEGLLQNPETARMFGRLDGARQRKLLNGARKEGQPLSHSEVARLDRAPRGGSPRREDTPEPDSESLGEGPDAPAAGELSQLQRDRVHVLRLTTTELRLLVRLLGGEPGDEDGLEFQIPSLLAAASPVDAREAQVPVL
jgi:ParB family chromosome partitioning protein